MKKVKKLTIRKLKNIQAFTPVMVVCLLIVAGAVIYNFGAHAANEGFYFQSTANSYRVGETFDLAIYEDSGSACANVVQADVTYPANLLRFNSFSLSGSKFDSPADSDTSSGKFSVINYTTRKECGSGATATSGVSGSQLIGRASFTVLAAGNAPINFDTSTIAVSAADNRSNVAPGTTGKALTLTAVPVTNPNPNPTPTPPTPPVTPNPPRRPTTPPVTSVQPKDTVEPIQLRDNDSIEISTPVDVQPLPIQPDGINRIEYYLSGKLVATVKTPPYKYELDPSKYLNGTYTLTTKTYYTNGQSKEVSQKVVVKNPFGISQLKLWIQRYAWLVILILLVLGAAVAAWIIHRRGNGPDNYYGDGSLDNVGDYTVSSGSYITPGDDNTGAKQSGGGTSAGVVTPEPTVVAPTPAAPAASGAQTYQPAGQNPPVVVAPSQTKN